MSGIVLHIFCSHHSPPARSPSPCCAESAWSRADDTEVHIVLPGQIELPPAHWPWDRRVSALATTMNRLLGADAGRDLRVDSREVARIQGRRHDNVLDMIGQVTENIRILEFQVSKYEVEGQTRHYGRYLCTVDGFRRLLKHGHTEAARLAREAEHQAFGELGRGEDTEGTRANWEARLAAAMPPWMSKFVELTHANLDALNQRTGRLEAETAGIRDDVTSLRGDVNSLRDRLEQGVGVAKVIPMPGLALPPIGWFSFSSLKKAGVVPNPICRMSEPDFSELMEAAGIPHAEAANEHGRYRAYPRVRVREYFENQQQEELPFDSD